MTDVVVILLSAIVFTAFLAVGQSVYWAYVARQDREQKELMRRLNLISESMQESLFRERARDSAAAALGKIGAHLQEVIDSADSQIQVGALLVQIVGLGIVGFVLGLLLGGGPAGLVLGVVLSSLPYFNLRRLGAQRAQKLIEQLPEALDLVSRSLQAGLGLNEAFRTCAEEMPLPIAQEFGRVFEEVRFGRDYREAFGNLVARNPGLFDLRLFVSSVLLQRETGGNMIEILDSISNTIRGRFLFQAKVKALTSEARASAMILGALPFGVTMVLMVSNPNYLTPLWTTSMGHMILLFVFTWYGLGVFLMYTLSQVEV